MKRKNMSLLAIGAALTLLLGSGLMALVSDSVASESNYLESGTYVPPAHNLVAARVLPDQECTEAEFVDDTRIDAVIFDEDFALRSADGATTGFDLCLKNAGDQMGRLLVTFSNVYEQETGSSGEVSCEPSELDPSRGGDTTCIGGDPGELRPIVWFAFGTPPATSPSCSIVEARFAQLEDGAILDADLEPGQICRVRPMASPVPETEQQQYAAQTDWLQWDMVFTLEDAGALGTDDVNPGAS